MSLAYRFRFASLAALLLCGCTDSSPKDTDIDKSSGADDDADDDGDDDDADDDDQSGPGTGKVDAGKIDAGKAADAKTPSDPKPGADAKVESDAKVVGTDAGGGDTGAGTGGPSGTACTGKKGSKRGKSDQNVMAGGASRHFIYYAPEGLDANEPVPLVIVPHGATMSSQMMFDITKYSELADSEKFVAIFPDGDPPNSLSPWNVGSGVCGLGDLVGGANNDLAFVDEMIKFASDDQCIDEDHIFMTGFSMGGYFSNENACNNPKIRAAGPHSGGTHDLGSCKNAHRPVIIMHHKDDALIWYDCGTDARDKWVAKNGCSMDDPEVVTVKGGTCEYYKGCPADGQVALCTFTDAADMSLPAGHAWSGGSQDGEGAFAAIPVNESSTQLSWSFFKKYAW